MLVNIYFQTCSKVNVSYYDETIYTKLTKGLEMRLRKLFTAVFFFLMPRTKVFVSMPHRRSNTASESLLFYFFSIYKGVSSEINKS